MDALFGSKALKAAVRDVSAIPKDKALGAGKLELARFKVVQELGRGTFGVAMLVEDKLNAGKRYVCKQTQLGGLRDKQVKSAVDEVKVLSSIKHANVVGFFGAWVEKVDPAAANSEQLFILLEYCDGGDLQQAIERRRKKGVPFSEGEVAVWFSQLLGGLTAIHAKRIIHRDLKGANVFLAGKGENATLKIGDFGICKAFTDDEASKAATNTGTPYFMAPEIINGQAYTYRADIWALGVITYELCTFKKPFDGANIPQLYMNIVKGGYAEAGTALAAYPQGMRDVVKGALTLKQNYRPATGDLLQMPYVQRAFKMVHALASEKAHAAVRAAREQQKTGKPCPLDLDAIRVKVYGDYGFSAEYGKAPAGGAPGSEEEDDLILSLSKPGPGPAPAGGAPGRPGPPPGKPGAGGAPSRKDKPAPPPREEIKGLMKQVEEAQKEGKAGKGGAAGGAGGAPSAPDVQAQLDAAADDLKQAGNMGLEELQKMAMVAEKNDLDAQKIADRNAKKHAKYYKSFGEAKYKELYAAMVKDYCKDEAEEIDPEPYVKKYGSEAMKVVLLVQSEIEAAVAAGRDIPSGPPPPPKAEEESMQTAEGAKLAAKKAKFIEKYGRDKFEEIFAACKAEYIATDEEPDMEALVEQYGQGVVKILMLAQREVQMEEARLDASEEREPAKPKARGPPSSAVAGGKPKPASAAAGGAAPAKSEEDKIAELHAKFYALYGEDKYGELYNGIKEQYEQYEDVNIGWFMDEYGPEAAHVWALIKRERDLERQTKAEKKAAAGGAKSDEQKIADAHAKFYKLWGKDKYGEIYNAMKAAYAKNRTAVDVPSFQDKYGDEAAEVLTLLHREEKVAKAKGGKGAAAGQPTAEDPALAAEASKIADLHEKFYCVWGKEVYPAVYEAVAEAYEAGGMDADMDGLMKKYGKDAMKVLMLVHREEELKKARGE